jgi:hypothetical protein
LKNVRAEAIVVDELTAEVAKWTTAPALSVPLRFNESW